MKNIQLSLVCLLFASLLFSCSKDNNTQKADTAFTYSVNNVQDQNFEVNGSSTMSVSANLLSGTAEPVTLAVNGLPSGVTVTPSTQTGTPNFSSNFVFKANNATVGTYPVTLESTSASTTKKEIHFNLKIAAPADCSGDVVATYSGPETCTMGSDNYAITVTASGTANRVNINNFYDAGFTVYANIDCIAKTLDIPTQTVTNGTNTGTVSGTGSYTATGIKITYTLVASTITNNCTMDFARQ